MEANPLLGADSLEKAAEDIGSILEPVENKPTNENEEAEETVEEEVSEEETEVEEESEAEEETEEIEEESEEEEDLEQETSDEEPERITFKVEGEEREATLDELKTLASKGTDYTHKTQKLAEDRKAVEANQAKTNEVLQEYSEKLLVAEKFLSAPVISEEDLDKLYDEDPDEARRIEREETKRQKKHAVVLEELRGVQKQALDKQQEQLKAAIEQEKQTLSQKMPEVLTGEGTKELVSFLTQQGYSEEEISQAYDHRALMLAEYARRYVQGISAKANLKKKKVAKAPKVQKPSGRRDKADVKAEAKSKKQNRLKKTGDVRDAAVVLEDILFN